MMQLVRKTLPVLSLVVAVVAVGCVDGASVSSYDVDYSTPVATMKTFLRAGRAAAVYAERDNDSAWERHLREAYRCLSDDYRKQLPFETFKVKDWRKFQFVTDTPTAGIQSMRYLGPERTRAVVVYDLAGSTRENILVKQEDGTWKMPPPGRVD